MAILAAALLPEAARAAVCGGLTATIVGTDAAETINGTSGNDVIAALGGNDTVNGLGGNDTICGGLGNDVITGGLGTDRLDGEVGTDTASYGSSLTAVNANLTTGSGTGEGTDTLVAIENLTGSKLNDVLTGSSLINTIVPGLGNDTVDGATGVDTVSYAASATAVVVNLTAGTATGQGSDTLSNLENVIGSKLNDLLTGNGLANNLNGGLGDDGLAGAAGNDAYIGGGGIDTASFASSAAGVTASFTTATATGDGSDTLNTVENFLGSDLLDHLTGDANANIIDGAGGNDILNGGGGPDTASFASSPVGVNASLATGTATGDGTDSLALFENLLGSEFVDNLTGDANANVIDGNGGNDTTNGGAGLLDMASFDSSPAAVTASLTTNTATGDGSDSLAGFEGLLGSKLSDKLTGDNNANTLDGGFGTDTCSLKNGLDKTSRCEIDDGAIETIGASDTLTFPVTAGQKVYVESTTTSTCNTHWKLTTPSGTLFDTGFCGDQGPFVPATTGTWTLTVSNAATTSTYALRFWYVQPPQTFAYTLGNTVSNGVPGPGAGNIETPATEDRYTFVGAAGQKVFFDAIPPVGCTNAIRWQLLSPSSTQIFESGVCSDFGQVTLPSAGTYTLRVYGLAHVTGTYSFRIRNVPPPQTFAYSVGNTVSNGVPGPGAGNIESPGAEDRYTFTGAAGQKLFFDSLPPVGCTNAIRWQLLNPSSTQIFESGVCSDFGLVTLPSAGTYTLRVYTINPSDATGTYSFRILNVPPPQTFAYTVGNTVSNGVPGPGAGNIESPGAEDRFTFTGAAGQKLFFDSLPPVGCTNAIRWQLFSPTATQIFETGVCSDFGPVTLPSAGTYTLRVYTINPSDATGTYSFKIVNSP